MSYFDKNFMNVLEQNIGDLRRFLTVKHHVHVCSSKIFNHDVYIYINKNKNRTLTDLHSNVYFQRHNIKKRCQYFRKFAKLC